MLERPDHSRRRAELRRARSRRYRARVKACKAVARVEYGADVLDLLLRTGWLLERNSADARMIEAALGAMLAASSAENLGAHHGRCPHCGREW